MSRLGMNTELANEVAGTVSGLASGLALIEQEVRLARAVSINPLTYMLNPGAMILAPASIGLAASVNVDIANVRQTLEYLVLKLRQEAVQQDQVSNSLTPADPGWFAPGPTARRPEDLTLLDEFAPGIDIANWILFVEGFISTAGDVFDKWWTSMPPWAQNVVKYADNVGKWVPFVGAPIGWVSVAAEWDDDYVWGNTRNIIGASIGTLELIALIPPLTPAAPIVGAVGLVWDVFDTVWDLGDDFWW
jgi:hypothetical protein